MKRALALVGAACLLLFAAFVAAQPVDPLWLSVTTSTTTGTATSGALLTYGALGLADGGVNYIHSDTLAANASASEAALTVRALRVLDANDLVFDAQISTGTSLFRVDKEGDFRVLGTLATTGSAADITSGRDVVVGASGDVIMSGANRAVYTAANGYVQLGGGPTDGAAAVAARIASRTDLTNATAKIVSFGDNSATSYAEQAFITGAGGLSLNDSLTLASFTDDSANAGNRTVNKVRGKSAFAALGSATITITNSYVTAASQIVATLEESDATLTQILRCTPAAGSFSCVANAAATLDTTFSWAVIK